MVAITHLRIKCRFTASSLSELRLAVWQLICQQSPARASSPRRSAAGPACGVATRRDKTYIEADVQRLGSAN